jgi:hypothetical protein
MLRQPAFVVMNQRRLAQRVELMRASTALTRMLCAFLLLTFLAAPAFGQQQAMERGKIEYLINSVAELHDAVFIRNGTVYDSKQAADHLRLKLRNARSRVRTAEDFIAYCATASSTSGEKYRIRFADGRIVDTAVFLREKLAALRVPT